VDRLENLGLQIMPAVAIVGAGWAGLTAAVRLADAGARVTLFESAKQGGGRARSVDWNGITIDNGQHLLVGAYAATLAILRQVGVDDASALHRVPLSVLVPGCLALRLPKLPAPFHLAVGLLSARGPTLAEKFSAARFMRRLQGDHYRLAEDLPVAEWLDRHEQHGVLRTHLWESLCLASLNTRPQEASAQVFANVLRDTLGGPRQATDLLLPATDLGRLFPAVAQQHLRKRGVELRLGSRVTAIVQKPQNPPGQPSPRWQIDTRRDSSRFDHVVLATGPQHATALLPPARELAATRAQIDKLHFEPIATAYLQYPPQVRLPQPLLALNHDTTQWLADRGQLGGPRGLLAHVLSAHGDWEKLSNEQLVDSLHRNTNIVLQRHAAIPALPAPQNHLVIREQRATFRCSPGLIRPSGHTRLPGLWLAGDYVASDYPGTLEAAVRSGEAVAAGILGAAAER
jgi:squalene-associated FAD-dependent desaturase